MIIASFIQRIEMKAAALKICCALLLASVPDGYSGAFRRTDIPNPLKQTLVTQNPGSLSPSRRSGRRYYRLPPSSQITTNKQSSTAPSPVPASTVQQKAPYSQHGSPFVPRNHIPSQEKREKEKSRLAQNSLEWQIKRAEEGSSRAQYALGLRYLTGDGVEKNELTARSYLKQAAENGETLAVKKLAELDGTNP
ncbi:MAG: hypothetical protein SFY81_03050 [Verrucomicrobiota bacterium]|nr:hypothetical protein [Verrucomicrobiota bacterium]